MEPQTISHKWSPTSKWAPAAKILCLTHRKPTLKLNKTPQVPALVNTKQGNTHEPSSPYPSQQTHGQNIVITVYLEYLHYKFFFLTLVLQRRDSTQGGSVDSPVAGKCHLYSTWIRCRVWIIPQNDNKDKQVNKVLAWKTKVRNTQCKKGDESQSVSGMTQGNRIDRLLTLAALYWDQTMRLSWVPGQRDQYFKFNTLSGRSKNKIPVTLLK